MRTVGLFALKKAATNSDKGALGRRRLTLTRRSRNVQMVPTAAETRTRPAAMRMRASSSSTARRPASIRPRPRRAKVRAARRGRALRLHQRLERRLLRTPRHRPPARAVAEGPAAPAPLRAALSEASLPSCSWSRALCLHRSGGDLRVPQQLQLTHRKTLTSLAPSSAPSTSSAMNFPAARRKRLGPNATPALTSFLERRKG